MRYKTPFEKIMTQVNKLGSVTKASKALGLNVRTVQNRIKDEGKWVLMPKNFYFDNQDV